MALNLALSARGSEASVKSLIRTSLFIEWTAEQIQEIVASVDSTRLAGHADVRVEDCLEGLEQPPTWMQPLSTDSVLRSEDHQSPLSEPKLNPEPAAATVPAPKPEPAPEPEPASSELATTRHISAQNGAAARPFRLTPQLQMKPEDLAPIASSIWRILLLNIGLLLISVGAAVCALQLVLEHHHSACSKSFDTSIDTNDCADLYRHGHFSCGQDCKWRAKRLDIFTI